MRVLALTHPGERLRRAASYAKPFEVMHSPSGRVLDPAYLQLAQKRWMRLQASSSTLSEVA